MGVAPGDIFWDLEDKNSDFQVQIEQLKMQILQQLHNYCRQENSRRWMQMVEKVKV